MSRPSSAVAASHRINMPAPNPPPRRPGRSTENVARRGGRRLNQNSQQGQTRFLSPEPLSRLGTEGKNFARDIHSSG